MPSLFDIWPAITDFWLKHPDVVIATLALGVSIAMVILTTRIQKRTIETILNKTCGIGYLETRKLSLVRTQPYHYLSGVTDRESVLVSIIIIAISVSD